MCTKLSQNGANRTGCLSSGVKKHEINVCRIPLIDLQTTLALQHHFARHTKNATDRHAISWLTAAKILYTSAAHRICNRRGNRPNQPHAIFIANVQGSYTFLYIYLFINACRAARLRLLRAPTGGEKCKMCLVIPNGTNCARRRLRHVSHFIWSNVDTAHNNCVMVASAASRYC